MVKSARRYAIVKDLVRLVFEEIELKLWNFIWNEYEGKLDRLIDVLFLVYRARC